MIEVNSNALFLSTFGVKIDVKNERKRVSRMCENAYMSIKNPKASRALKWALDPGHRLLASLTQLHFATWATFSLRDWGSPLTKSWIRTCVNLCSWTLESVHKLVRILEYKLLSMSMRKESTSFVWSWYNAWNAQQILQKLPSVIFRASREYFHILNYFQMSRMSFVTNLFKFYRRICAASSKVWEEVSGVGRSDFIASVLRQLSDRLCVFKVSTCLKIVLFEWLCYFTKSCR